MNQPEVRYEGAHCTLTIRRPAARVLVVSLSGQDVGEFRDVPHRELEKDLGNGLVELYIDAREGLGATVDVSSVWALWLQAKKAHFAHVSMLTGSRFIQMSAEFVKRFAGMGEVMRLYTDPAAFDAALAASVAGFRWLGNG
jgi:hypothetical protein